MLRVSRDQPNIRFSNSETSQSLARYLSGASDPVSIVDSHGEFESNIFFIYVRDLTRVTFSKGEAFRCCRISNELVLQVAVLEYEEIRQQVSL